MYISGCLEYLITKLESVSTTSDERASELETSFRTRFCSLPTELQERVFSFITPLSDLSLEKTNVLPRSFWQSFVLDRHFIGYLWDLQEPDHNSASFARLSEGKDWELLVRQLNQDYIFEAGNVFYDCPKGLRNRHRIWRLLQEMRPGDHRPFRKRRSFYHDKRAVLSIDADIDSE